MFVIHVGMAVRAGHEQPLEKDYSGSFKEAISAQEGFSGVSLLRPNDGGEYLLSIVFENQALQQKWVATELHGQVWPMMENHLAGYTVKTYTAG
jgi:heme-degrading monooxygenase HmoA